MSIYLGGWIKEWQESQAYDNDLETHTLLKKNAVNKKEKPVEYSQRLHKLRFSSVNMDKSHNYPVLHFHIFKKEPTALPIPQKLCDEHLSKEDDIHLFICLICGQITNT